VDQMPRVVMIATPGTPPGKQAGRRREREGYEAFQTAKKPTLAGRSHTVSTPPPRADMQSPVTPRRTPEVASRPAPRTYGRKRGPEEARLPKTLLNFHEGSVVRSLDFGDDDAAGAFTEGDAKLHSSIVVTQAGDCAVWTALQCIAGLSSVLACADRIELSEMCVENGSFALTAHPRTKFRTADRHLLAKLRALQWDPQWKTVESYQLPVVQRAAGTARAAEAPAAKPGPTSASRTIEMPAIVTTPSELEPGFDDDSAGSVVSQEEGWRSLSAADYLLLVTGAPAAEQLSRPAVDDASNARSDDDPGSQAAPWPAAPGGAAAAGSGERPPLPVVLSAERRASDAAGCLLACPAPVRAVAGALDDALDADAEASGHTPAAADDGGAATSLPAATTPTEPAAASAVVPPAATSAVVPRGKRLALGLGKADSALANLFAMAASLDAQYASKERALPANCELLPCIVYSDMGLRELNAEFCAEDERIGAFPPSGPIKYPFVVHLLVSSDSAEPSAKPAAIAYILHSGPSDSDDILPELHHVFVRRSHRRRGHALRMVRWWIDRYAQHSFTFAVNDPNNSMQRVLQHALACKMRPTSSRVAGCSSSHYYLADPRLELREE